MSANASARPKRHLPFSLPGTREPRPMPVDPALLAWADSIRNQISADRLREDVMRFPGPRNRLHAPQAMLAAEDAVLGRLEEFGWPAQRRPFTFTGVAANLDYGKFEKTVYPRLDGANLVATREGQEDTAAVVILAHLDTVRDTPGANDNTASIAVLLELARVLSPYQFRHALLLALPDMEEVGLTGARALAAELVAQRRILGVICFDTVAYITQDPNTQRMPPRMELLFPGQVRRLQNRQWRGDFSLVAYNGPATRLAARFAGGLEHFAGPDTVVLLCSPGDLPLIGGLLTRRLPMVRNFGRSDHRPFWEAAVPALMVTDTANFRYSHYHQPTDTPEKLDYQRLADIAAATAVTIALTAGLTGL